MILSRQLGDLLEVITFHCIQEDHGRGVVALGVPDEVGGRSEGLCRYGPCRSQELPPHCTGPRRSVLISNWKDTHVSRPLVGTGLALARLRWFRRRKQEVLALTRCTEEG